jgi:5,10-methylenetetrahydromethanopterin reductase
MGTTTVADMRMGFFGGSINDGTIDQVVAEAKLAESDGYASYWVPQIFGHDALTVLAILGREVPRIELGTSVVPTYPRHPMMLAQQARTVNAASDGRLCLGIGLSHQIVIENMMGMSFDKPVRHLREYLSVLMPLINGEPVDFTGDTYSTHSTINVGGSTPCQVVVAALGTQMLNVTARMAHGTLTWCTGPSTLASHIIPTINAAAAEAERPAPRVIAALPVCVTGDATAAYERAAAIFAMYGYLPSYRAMLDREGAAGPADIAIVGSATEVRDRIHHLAEIGVSDFGAVTFPANPDEDEATRAVLKEFV